MPSKSLVRISPLLLGRVADVASNVQVGSLIVQFAGVGVEYQDAKEWNVTHAILSNSLAVTSSDARTQRNQQVDSIMQCESLLHIGWLRQASRGSSLGSLDIDTQRVYEKHFPDAFAALLDLHNAQEPMVYFYNLQEGRKTHETSFAAAQHIVLDSSVSFSVIEVSLEAPCSSKAMEEGCGKLAGSAGGSRNSDETDITHVQPPEAPPSLRPVSVDDLMAVSVL